MFSYQDSFQERRQRTFLFTWEAQPYPTSIHLNQRLLVVREPSNLGSSADSDSGANMVGFGAIPHPPCAFVSLAINQQSGAEKWCSGTSSEVAVKTRSDAVQSNLGRAFLTNSQVMPVLLPFFGSTLSGKGLQGSGGHFCF